MKKMKSKSKSFDLNQSPAGRGKNNKTFDFVGLYKSAAESNNFLSENPKPPEETKNDSKTMNVTPKRERSPNKNKKRFKNEAVEVTQININGSNLNSSLGSNTPTIGTKVTSTPNPSAKSKSQVGRVKSIMKSKEVNGDDSMEDLQLDVPTPSSTKSKKRNKSVSFMLDDNEEVVIKKTKSNESLKVDTSNNASPINKAKFIDKKKNKKIKSDQQSEKENKVSDTNNDIETEVASANLPNNKKIKINKKKNLLGDAINIAESQNTNAEKKKKLKKEKRQKKVDPSEPTENAATNEGSLEVKNKKTKKKKRQAKSQTDSTETEGEPAMKSRKKDVKPELIAEDLENLSIGDNAHTLTNLLDEMMVVDKVKRKRLRQKLNKAKKHIISSETGDIEKAEGEKEKLKWKKRKWNKDKKADMIEDLATTVIVEGLPLSIMLNYKTLLTEYFSKLGLIKRIGIAEVYPTEESRPVFTTTITFSSDEAAQLALDEDKSTFEGSRIRVKRPLPPTETTVVLRSYGDVSPQAVGALLTGAGKIRNIRHLVKGKKAMSSVFIEFDGPESVERAMKMAEDAKVGGKKIHASKYEIRQSKHKNPPKSKAKSESEADESDDSN